MMEDTRACAADHSVPEPKTKLEPPLGGGRAGKLLAYLSMHVGAGLLLIALAGAASAAVHMPAKGDNLLPGDPIEITWDSFDGCGAVDIDLYQGTDRVCTIAAGTPDVGSFLWGVEDCGLDPACNLRIRIGCGAESAFSERFAVSGLLLEAVVPGDRTVELTWTRLESDTLGAGNAPTIPGGSIFAGYNIWRQTFDNRLNPQRRDHFTKIRSYDVREDDSDTTSLAWNFTREALPVGPSDLVEEGEEFDDDDVVDRDWILAQTFTPDESFDLCRARVFFGEVRSGWVFDVRIVNVTAGIPDFDDALSMVEDQDPVSGFAWRSFEFPSPVPLNAGQTYALAISAEPSTGNESIIFWVGTTYDSYDGGTVFSKKDDDGWEPRVGIDLSFVLAETIGATCRDVMGQRLGGSLERRFRDAEDILAFERDEELALSLVDVPGPYNGFQLRYAVTAFYRAELASGNIEKPSACEDTLFAPSGFPEGVQPTSSAIWPDVVFPNSEMSTGGRAGLLRDVYPVPNPYVRDSESPSFPRWELPGERRIDFVNLPRGARIRLTTISAETVRIIEHTEDHGTARWDLRNSSGEIVTSGVYLYFVTAPNGEKTSGQLIIVR
jgi:hypothetical protein